MPAASAATAPVRRGVPLGAAVSLLCLAFGAIEAAQQYAGSLMRGAPGDLENALVFSVLPWVPAALLAPAVVWCGRRVPLDRGRRRRAVAMHVAAMLAFIALHEVAAALVVLPWMSIPFGGMLLAKQLTFRSALDAAVYAAIVGVTHAARATREAREREQAAARLEAGLAEARLAALRAQLDPHFLFNTLNAVSALALRGDGERVVQALSTLSDMLRTTLGGAPTQEVALADELALLDRYLDIQRLRFSDRLTVERDVSEDALGAAVPAMLLQPLVENAVQHGVAARPGPTRIAVRAARVGDSLRVEVRDGGPGFPRAAPDGESPNGGSPDGARAREGIGLANTRERLAQLYGDAQRLECRNVEGGGALVAVTLPFRPIPQGRGGAGGAA
jgi:anti-sigma regulatory factor (Ser/Thr protein kinase)